MKTTWLFVVLVFTLGAAPFAFAEAAEAGNAACPISGDKVSPKVSYEYKGKTYHFCCAGCINKFKKDPEKYTKIAEDEAKAEKN